MHLRMENQERSLGEIVTEIKREVKEFLNTRLEMVRVEIHEAVRAGRIGLPLFVLALGLIAIASLMFTLALVALVASAFAGSPYAWFFAFAIVGILWTVAGAIAAFFAYNEFRGRFPKRTMEVLKADKLWLQSEIRS
ncbi:MAG: phage holin family protein [Acidobacteria bacterium]|nr:phage holin family protein [Acidobacteriota bacterium]